MKGYCYTIRKSQHFYNKNEEKMQTTYYVLTGDPQVRRDLRNVESIQVFFDEDKRDDGKLFILGIDAVTINYNLKTGEVTLENIGKQSIKIFLPEDPFISTVKEALRCYVKQLFLEWLGHDKIPSNSSERYVNFLLYKMLNEVKPIGKLTGFFSRQIQTPEQWHRYLVFKEFGLYQDVNKIYSKNSATDLLNKIHQSEPVALKTP
jgi:hypothetical protein